MDEFISITTLCDFLFCPYSIYLHGIYSSLYEEAYHCSPQKKGSIAHEGIESRIQTTKDSDILAMTVYSNKYQLVGRIDLYDTKEKRLVEYKYSVKTITSGMKIQLWAQMICMIEMGYEVDSLELYAIDSEQRISIPLPTEKKILFVEEIIKQIRSFNPIYPTLRVENDKCAHCIYSGLCNKTSIENVYN